MSRIFTLTLNPALDLSTEAPEVVPDLKLRCAQPRADAGGGGVNVSRAIAFLGGETVAALALGGSTGAQVRARLVAEGIPLWELGVSAQTRENLSVICQATHRQFRFIMPGAVWSKQDLAAAIDAFCDGLRPGDIVVPSGSLPPGVESSALVDLQARLGPLKVRTILDTSGPALRAMSGARQHPLDLLRMDLEEAESLSGARLSKLRDVARVTEHLAARGCARAVVVAKGAEGSVLSLDSGETWHVRPPVVEVVSKTGAGDSFVAGYTLASSRGADPLEACILGVGAACSTVTSADTDLCNKRDADRYAEQSIVTEL
ncbi:1-phosphofructokinase family hexose kinase [Dinoroseobacter sp. S124A]|uniref:1-phosphofructokinase family hexose kinase n=1 Tax=Dinoroseobacter sp. S124A TaxID=3415128 RepID=UPI003C7DE79F